MIVRIWRGWTTPANADSYEALLRERIFPGIAARAIPGAERIELLRREGPAETGFTTIMWFEDLAAVRRFAGEDIELAVVPPEARAVLTRFDAHSEHHELRLQRSLAGAA